MTLMYSRFFNFKNIYWDKSECVGSVNFIRQRRDLYRCILERLAHVHRYAKRIDMMKANTVVRFSSGEKKSRWAGGDYMTRCASSGDDCDESRAWGFPHGAGSGRGQLHVGAVNVPRLSTRGSALPRGPVHGQFRSLRPVPGLSAAARLPGAPWHLHAALAFPAQPS